jgi:polysaccharide deacetylase family protein (PEP-CTERM system associated)
VSALLGADVRGAGLPALAESSGEARHSAPGARRRQACVPAPARIVNAMTIDVEDYFHVSVFDGVVPRSAWDTLESRVCGNTDRLLDIFAEHDVRGTFFILGWVAERFPALVRRVAAAGHEIASHGYGHRLVYDQTPAAFREDVRRAKALLEHAAGVPVLGYRAPSYSIVPRSLWALDVLIDEGYRYDSSIFPVRHDRYGIPMSPRHPYAIDRPAGRIVEAPASTVRFGPVNLPVGGGGYFRILPYGWAEWGIARLNEVERAPAIFYLHPWEIDPEQPRLHAGLLSRFRHYRNLGDTERRLRLLLRRFTFGSMRDVLPVPAHAVAGAAVPGLPYLW